MAKCPNCGEENQSPGRYLWQLRAAAGADMRRMWPVGACWQQVLPGMWRARGEYCGAE